MILLHCEALIWRGDRRLWFKPRAFSAVLLHTVLQPGDRRGCTLCVCTGRNHHCFPHTHFSPDPRNSSTRGVQSLWAHPGGHSRSPSEEGSGMLCLPHSALVTLAVLPWAGKLRAGAAAQPHFISGGAHPSHSHQIPCRLKPWDKLVLFWWTEITLIIILHQ